MKRQYTQDLKTNEFGEIDVNYYIARGWQLRAETVGEMFQTLFAKLRSRRAKTRHLPLNLNFRH